MKPIIFILLLITTATLFADNKLFYELKESNSKIHGEKILFPYFYNIEKKEREIHNLNEIFKFLVLRNDKLYGRSSVVITPETEKKLSSEKILTIKLENYSKSNFKDILGEVVYSFTSNGIKGVILLNNPIDEKKIFSRDDVNYTTFTLLINMWRVLPPNRIEDAFIKLPNNNILKTKEFYKKLKKNDKKIVKFLLNYIKNGKKQEKINSMRALSYIKNLKKRDKYLLPELENKDNDIVLAALDGLGGFNKTKILTKIEELLKKSENDSIKLNSAKILIASGKKKFVISGLEYFLKSNKIEQKVSVIKSISKYKNSEDMLLLMLDDKNEKIKLTTLEFLKSAKKDKVFNKLKELLNDDSEKVKIASSNILTTNKKYKRFGLYYQLTLNDSKTAIAASKTLEKFKNKETTENLIKCLKHNDLDVAYSCANTLLVHKDKTAIVPFFTLADRNQKSLPKGMDKKFINLLKKDEILSLLVKEKIDLLQKDAIEKLGNIYEGKKDTKIVKVISSFLDSKNELVRIETVKSLSKISGKEALNAVISKRADSSLKVRFEILKMLNNYSKDEVEETLLIYLNDTDDSLRVSTMDSLIKFKIEKAIPQLKQYITSSIKKVKLKSLEALVTISRKIDSEMEGKFQELLDQDDSEVRVWAIYGLVKTYKKPNLPFVTIYAKDSLAKVRKAVVYAVSELNNPQKTQIDILYGALDDDDKSVRYEAGLGLGKIGTMKDIDKIKELAKKNKDEKLKNLLNSAAATIKDRNTIE